MSIRGEYVFDIDSAVDISSVWRVATVRGTLAWLGIWSIRDRVCSFDYPYCPCTQWEVVG